MMRSASFLSSAPVTIQFIGQTRWQINNQQNAVFLSKQCCAPIFLMVIFIWWNIYSTYKQIFIIIHNTLINF
jgi:hypothetical protein